MTTVNSTLSPALERALDLLSEPPTEPDASKGYLDLLGSSAAEDEGPAKNTGPIQAVWASSIGSMLYDNAQALSRRFLSSLQHPIEWLNIPQGGIALDVGAGPGSAPVPEYPGERAEQEVARPTGRIAYSHAS